MCFVREVNAKLDNDGNFFVRKAMIHCVMSLNYNGIREIDQLFERLQGIMINLQINLMARYLSICEI